MADRHSLGPLQGVGVDAPQENDLYYRLLVDKCFYVGGMGAAGAAQALSREVCAAL